MLVQHDLTRYLTSVSKWPYHVWASYCLHLNITFYLNSQSGWNSLLEARTVRRCSLFLSIAERGDKTYPLTPPTQSMFCPEALDNKYTSRHSLSPSSKKVQSALKSQGWTYSCLGERNLFLSFLWYQQCPLSMKVHVQDTETLFEWRGTSQPRSDGTVEKPNRTEYLWRLWPNRNRTFTLICKGLQLSYHSRLSVD